MWHRLLLLHHRDMVRLDTRRAPGLFGATGIGIGVGEAGFGCLDIGQSHHGRMLYGCPVTGVPIVAGTNLSAAIGAAKNWGDRFLSPLPTD